MKAGFHLKISCWRRTADFSANERVKIKSYKKYSKCRRKITINENVVFQSLIRTSTINSGFFCEAKYILNCHNYDFKIINRIKHEVRLCQICCENFLTKDVLTTNTSPRAKHSFFPKNTKILQSLAKTTYYYSNGFVNLRVIIPGSIIYNKLMVIKHFKFSKLLSSGDIESNPGPKQKSPQVVSIKTYNVRGLKDRLKLKRVLNSCHKLINENRNTIIFLQETHLETTDKQTLDLMWHHNYVMSQGTNRQCGCLILFDPSWNITTSKIDNEGRACFLVLKKFEINFILANIYAPNDHDLNFFASIFNQLITFKTTFPDAKIVLAGDFNIVMSDNDSVNRKSSNNEIQCRAMVKRNLDRLELEDCYRAKHPQQGFTWSRGNCMSRLDMVFASHDLVGQLTSAKVDWTFDDSDHAMVESNFAMDEKFVRGPGLYRVNIDVLDNVASLATIEKELKAQIEQMPDHWNPHFKLDFVKSAVRSIISLEAGKLRKSENSDETAIKEQLNFLKKVKEDLVMGQAADHGLLNNINETILTLEAEYNVFLDNKAKNLSLRAKSKWFEHGERSNKYFLNIIKKRTEQTMITRLVTDEFVLETQELIMNHTTEFYKKLYDKNTTDTNYYDLLSDCPSLNDEQRKALDDEITLEELRSTVNNCKDSAPGPDGIPYKVYSKLWTLLGPILLDAWKYSISIKTLPYDQRLSVITLLPKEGKNLERIENWRPITLTNCDLKIFTKLIANRVSKVLDKLIHPCQTAYIPGRVVHDNLRVFEFYKNYCSANNVDALLISLDAKKAFDSVSHEYMHKVLEAYGFSNEFIDVIKLLYKDLQAQILVNGYKSTIIKILRSVKQGDALSCALFILCIDPLIRRLESNPNIKPAQVSPSKYSNIKIENKVGGFADDVGLVVNNDRVTIDCIFKDYELFTKLSGIEINIDKTEILSLRHNSTHQDFVPVSIRIKGKEILTKETIKICGIYFSNNINTAYENNIIDKIEKMERQLIMWLQRALSIEGKILIVKTFGLSQLIYSLQMCQINERELIDIERMIFKFLWNKKWVGNIAPDRIKRIFLKQPYDKGGLNVPDIKILNSSLKIKQFLRAMKSTHPINLIQKYQLEELGYDEYYKCEYSKMSSDPIIVEFQSGCNVMTDKARNVFSNRPTPNPQENIDSVNVIASTDILEYLQRKKYPLILCRYKRLANLGIGTYMQLLNESRFPSSDEIGQLSKYILSFFPEPWAEVVTSADDVNSDISYENEFPLLNSSLTNYQAITVKNLRKTFMELVEPPPQPYLTKSSFEFDGPVPEHNPYLILRKAIRTPRDRFFKYRILHGDIFCNERNYKFKMATNPYCEFCGNQNIIESVRHCLWECSRAKNVWNHLNVIISESYGIGNYITYDTIVMGGNSPIMLVEYIILIALKLILKKDRSHEITSNMLCNEIKLHHKLEKILMRDKPQTFDKRWKKLSRSNLF